jgi:hypothetical protein
MMLNETFTRRFAELEERFSKLPFQISGSSRYVPGGRWRMWATSAQSLILAVFGGDSPHYTNFVAQYAGCNGYESDVKSMHVVFQSAKEDFLGGYVFNVDLRVSGEVFGDLVTLAKQSLSEGYKDVAAVLASAALEDALKRFALVSGLDPSNKTMQEVINSLKSAGLVSGAQKTLLDAMPRVRNMALHADWSKISEPDVNSVIGFVEQFLLSKFGGG